MIKKLDLYNPEDVVAVTQVFQQEGKIKAIVKLRRDIDPTLSLRDAKNIIEEMFENKPIPDGYMVSIDDGKTWLHCSEYPQVRSFNWGH